MPPFEATYPLSKGTTVVVVGLGLMGASLAAALKQRGPDLRIGGVSRRPETVDFARERSWIDFGTCELAAAVPAADLVVLATPVRVIIEQINAVVPLMREGAVLTDIGSTKRTILTTMACSSRPERCVGGHPMCGKEKHGIEAADSGLYEGATWAICPSSESEEPAINLVAALAATVGAKPLLFDASLHDIIVSRTSHLPYLVAAALAQTVARKVSTAELHALSAGGYRDTTRLAASDGNMMLDILLTNKDEILLALADMREELTLIYELLDAENGENLGEYLAQARSARRLP